MIEDMKTSEQRAIIWHSLNYSLNVENPPNSDGYAKPTSNIYIPFPFTCGIKVMTHISRIKNLKKLCEYLVLQEGMLMWSGIEKEQAKEIEMLEKAGWTKLHTFKSRMPSAPNFLYRGDSEEAGGHYNLVVYKYERDPNYDPRLDPN